MLAALHMLLGECCSGAVPTAARLPALLARSREYQSAVSTALAKQVLDALYEMVRGFQSDGHGDPVDVQQGPALPSQEPG
jgi:hypothetical protein